MIIACLILAVSSAATPKLVATELSSVFTAGDCDTTGECYPYFRIPALKRVSIIQIIMLTSSCICTQHHHHSSPLNISFPMSGSTYAHARSLCRTGKVWSTAGVCRSARRAQSQRLGPWRRPDCCTQIIRRQWQERHVG